jgi:outer membrane protein assembly factor BamB
MATVPAAQAGNWPRFRGPNGTGISEDRDIPVHWTEKEFAWKTPLPGAGNSSPIVWGDRVFLQSARKDGKERYLLCVNAVDGKLLWLRVVPGEKAGLNPRNTYASSTPATDGERVYGLFWDGRALMVHAFDLNGNPLWKYDLGPFAGEHGAGASPIVHENKVLLLNDHNQAATVVALESRGGTKVWEANRESYRACYSTPFVLDRPGQASELVVASTTGITGYDLASGARNWHWRWHFSGMPLRTVASPIFGAGLIFFGGGDGGGDRHFVAIQPGQKGNPSSARLAWGQEKRLLPYVPCYLAQGDHLFWVNDTGLAGCSLARTGEIVWTARLGGVVYSSPVLIDGKVYAVNEAGMVFIFPAETQFKLLARHSLGERVLASPAVAGGRLFIRGDTHLFCIRKP